MRNHTLSISLAFAFSVFLLLLAGCAGAKKTTLNGHKIYEKSEVDRPPQLISSGRFSMSYTTSSRDARLRDAVVAFVVNRKGKPVNVRMVVSTGNREADRSLMQGVSKGRYVPGLLDDEPVPVRMTREFNFGR